jgi:hypothetical protein
MTAFRVVEQLDIIEHILPGVFPHAADLAANALALQQLKETLSHRIIVTVTTSAHALLKIVRLQKVLPTLAAELAALIRIRHYCFRWLASPHRRLHRIRCRLVIHAWNFASRFPAAIPAPA